MKKETMQMMISFGAGLTVGALTTKKILKKLVSKKSKAEDVCEHESEDETEDDDKLSEEDFIEVPSEKSEEIRKTIIDEIEGIDDMDEEYLRHKQERNSRFIKKMQEAKKKTVIEYNNIIKENGYYDFSDDEDEDEDLENAYMFDTTNANPESYIISPDEYMEYPDYTHLSLIYHSDGVIADQEGSEIEDPDHVLMPDIRSHFGEYEECSVYIRNDSRMVEYEILWDDEPFREESY